MEVGFKKTLKEATEEKGNFEIEEVLLNDDTITVVYYYPTDEESKDVSFQTEGFKDYLETNDPNWENYNYEDIKHRNTIIVGFRRMGYL